MDAHLVDTERPYDLRANSVKPEIHRLRGRWVEILLSNVSSQLFHIINPRVLRLVEVDESCGRMIFQEFKAGLKAKA